MNRLCSVRHPLRLFATVAALASLSIVHGQPNSEVPDRRPPALRRPNIILILADNIGYGDLGCYGQTKVKTPNLDKLAADGIRFTSFLAGSPDPEPARAGTATGVAA